MGFLATVLTAWLSARWRRSADIQGRLLEARVRVFGLCVDALSEHRRATHNRVKTRIEGPAGRDRDAIRQDAYQSNARARAAIGQAAIITGTPEIVVGLEAVRVKIQGLNSVKNKTDLDTRADELDIELERALEGVRDGLMKPVGTRHR